MIGEGIDTVLFAVGEDEEGFFTPVIVFTLTDSYGVEKELAFTCESRTKREDAAVFVVEQVKRALLSINDRDEISFN